MIPDAVLSAFVEAKGAREATRAIQGVQDQLQQATKAAELATAAVNRFGRVRGIAVLDVDAARARAQAAEATKQVEGFGRERASATLDADATKVRVATAEATREVQAFGRVKATAVLDTDTRKIAAMNNEVRRSTQNVGGLANSFDGLRSSKTQTDRLIDRNVGTFGQLAARIRGAGDATVGVRGSLGPLSGGLGVVATAALFFGTSLLSIAGPAVAVAAALAPLIGLAAGVAGGLVAAAQGFGVFKLATMGVLDALKEQNKASQTAGTGALKQAGQEVSAGRAIRSAQEAVTAAKEATGRAAVALGEAQRTERQAVAALGPAYTEARMRLRDMRDAVIGTNLSLRDAQFAASDARKALADLLSGPSPRALADAHTAVADAMRGERSAAEGLADATKALNDLLSPPAVLDLADARDAVADATRGETRAQLDLARQLTATNAVLADPTSTEADKADARLRLADAENAVGDAARSSARAQAALAKLEAPATQDELARARGRVQDAEAAVAAAKRDTLDAQDALSKVETPASSDDIARARLALAEAEHGLTDAVKDSTRAARDYRTAEAAGLAQAPSVIAAREAFRSAALGTADAERSLADAQRAEAIAARSVSEAQADAARSSAVAAGAAVNLNQKMNALPPAAQAFVRQLQAMKPRLDELRQTAAQGFFPGATEGLRAAMGSFSSVNKVVGETSTVLGDAARKSGELVGSPAFGRDIEIIGGRNAKVIDTLGEALRHVISALRHVLVAAGPLTQWLADLANKWALNAAVAAKAGRENGKLADFFDRTRAVTVRLLSIIGHLTHGLFGVGKAGTDSGNSILLSIDRAAKRFDEWANSVGGQSTIREFFDKTRQIAAALVPAIANVASAFGLLALRLLPVTTALRLVGPYADEAIVAFVAWKLAITAVNIVMKLFAAQAAIAAFATGGWTTAFWALNAAIAANPIGIAVIALAALVAGLVLAWHSSETFRDVVLGAWDAIKNGVGATLDWMTAAVSNAWAFITSTTRGAWSAITGFLTGAWTGLQSTANSTFGAIGSFITNKWNDIRSATTSVWSAITSGLATAWSAITSAATAAWGLIRDAILNPIRAARDAFPAITGAISGGLSTAWAGITGGATTAWNTVRDAVLNPLRAVRDLIPDILDGIANRVTHGFDIIVAGAKDFAGNVKDAIVGGIKDGANAVVSLVNDIISVINVLPGVDIGKVKALRAGGTLGPADAAAASSATAAVTPFAQGGAFGMTGGLVNRPIAVLGEEAPCIARGTLIQTAMGLKAIEYVRVGERVLTRNGYRSVVWSGITRRNATVVCVTTDDGDSVLCTPDHRIWTMGGELDGNGSRDRVGGRTVRGGGVPSGLQEPPREPLAHDLLTNDGPRHGATVQGHPGGARRCAGPLGQRARTQAHVRSGHLRTYGCETCDAEFSAMARNPQNSESHRGTSADRHTGCSRCATGQALPSWSSPITGEHLCEPEGLRDLPDMQTCQRTGMGEAQVRNEPCLRAAATRRITGGCPADACRSHIAGAEKRETPQVMAPEARWREARELAVGDWVWTLNTTGELTPSRVASVEAATERIDTYDLCVEHDHEFVAGGILVHNSHPEFVIPTNPAYRGRAQHLAVAAASAVGVPGFALGGILDAVKGGASGLWDIASGGVGGLVGGLPGIGDLPDWIRGLGSWVIDRIKNWITDQVGGLLGGGGGDKANLGGVMKAATDLAKEHFPYLYGGGHGNFAIQPVDCSGGVSYALHGGHMLSSPVTTDGLKVYGESGDGDLITIGVRGSTGRNAHTMMQIAGRFYESGSGHGWARTNGWSGNFPIHRHPKGFAQGGMMDAMLADIFDPADVGWGLARGGLLGSFQRGTDYVPQTGPYLLHRGESVTPAAAGLTGNDLVEAIRQGLGELDVRLVIDGEAIDSRVQIVVDRRDRAVSNGWAAGRLSP